MKTKVTVTVLVDHDCEEAKYSRTVEDFVESEVSETLHHIEWDYSKNRPDNQGKLESGTTWEYKTEEIK